MAVTPADCLPAEGFPASAGPLYLQLRQALEEAIRAGRLKAGEALPAERDLAAKAGISRVTVRKAVEDLVRDGLLLRRQGSGTFVAAPPTRMEQSLSRLTSFSEDMARRGLATRAEWLERGLFPAAPAEMMALGLSADAMVARLGRLRIADDVPLAVERASVSASVLPDPAEVTGSLYTALAQAGARPVRAVQRLSAQAARPADAALLGIAPGSACLSIERVAYLATGRAVEFTHSLFRGDAYDFVAELTLGERT